MDVRDMFAGCHLNELMSIDYMPVCSTFFSID